MKFHLILAALVAFPIACQAADLQSREQPPAYIDASMQPAFDTEVQRRRDIEQFLAPLDHIRRELRAIQGTLTKEQDDRLVEGANGEYIAALEKMTLGAWSPRK